MSYSFEQFEALKGSRLTLEKVLFTEVRALGQVLISPTTWFSQTRQINNSEQFATFMGPLIQKQACGELLVLRAVHNDEIVAMSVYQFPSPGFTKVEIGFSWIADKWQRTFVNTELKLMMLTYAFETMNVKRVEFSVSPKNPQSNQAMLRIGAKLEGTLRKWRFLSGMDDGDRNMYSIIDDEWPAIKAKLVSRL